MGDETLSDNPLRQLPPAFGHQVEADGLDATRKAGQLLGKPLQAVGVPRGRHHQMPLGSKMPGHQPTKLARGSGYDKGLANGYLRLAVSGTSAGAGRPTSWVKKRCWQPRKHHAG